MAFTNCCAAISRIWLVLVNIIFLGISLLSFIVGSGILSLKNPEMTTNGVILIVFGVFFLITALSGCCGSMCRLVSFLTFYIVAVSINLLLLGVGGIISLVQTIQRKTSWARMTVEDWKKLTDLEKDFTQQAVFYIHFSFVVVDMLKAMNFNIPVNHLIFGNSPMIQ
jgi:hypothetical protein